MAIGYDPAMAKDEKPDPIRDPTFQAVIRHFVTTPHKPHKAPKEAASQTSSNDKRPATKPGVER
jgi:hypothetical protein